MTFRFLRKRWSSGSSEKFQYELDKGRSNKTVLKIEDKQTVTYILNSGVSGNQPPGLAKANHPLSSSVPLSYFEVFIVSGGKDNVSTSTIAVGLATHEYSVDLFPGWIRGSYGYHGDDGRKYSGLPGGVGEAYGPTFGAGDVIGVGLDNASSNVFFTKNGRYLGSAFKRTGVVDLYPCVGLNTPGETVFVNFAPPFVFDHVAAQTGGIGTSIVALEEVGKGRGYEDLHWDLNRCGKSLEITAKVRAQVALDAPHSAIGVVQCSLPFSPYHAETFSYFEVLIDRLEKGHVSIGLSNHEYPLNLHIGWLKRSYGYHSDDGRKFKWKDHESGTNDGELYGPSFGQGDTIGCGLNLQTRELYFTKNGSFLGVAFTNVYGILYPSIALTGPGDAMVANFYPPFKYSLFTNALINLTGSTGSANSSSSSILPPPPPPLNEISSPLSVSAPSIRNTPGQSGNGASPTAPESPPRAHSFLHNHASTSTYPSHTTRSPQSTHQSTTATSTPSTTSSALGTSPQRTTMMMSKSTPSLSSSIPNTTISATITNLQRSTGQKFNNSSGSGSGSGSSTESVPHPSSSLSQSSQLSNASTSSTPSPPISPRTILSISNSSMSDDAHVLGAPTPAPTPAMSGPSLSSSGGTSGNGWRKCGKSIKLKDEITATLAKKKTGLVQGALRCSTAQRLWYFEVYIEGMDKRASMCIGLTCEDYSLNKHIGKEHRSFGYFSEEGRKWRNGESSMDAYGRPYGNGDVVGCGFNTFTREIFFTKNGIYLGVAFWDVPDIQLFFSVSLRGVVGLTCVATFHGPFKFDLHSLPAISPSMWSESLGDPTLSDEQVIYPPSANSSRLQQQHQQQTWNKESNGGREVHGLYAWPANDVAIWLESIGYGQYRREFHNNNISGRHLQALSHQLLKNEIGVESYGHRADILDRVNKLLITWKEKAGPDESGSLMEYSSEFSTPGGPANTDYSDQYITDTNGASLSDSHTSAGDEQLLQPFRPPLLHHPQAVHRFSDHENSEDENTRAASRSRNRNLTSLATPQVNSNPNMHNISTPAGMNNLVSSLSNLSDKDSKWRRRTVPCPDVEPPATPSASSAHAPAQLNHRPAPANRPRTNTGNLPLPTFDLAEALAHVAVDSNSTTGHNHKPKPLPFQNHSQLAASTLSFSPPVIHTSPQPLINHPTPNSQMSASLTVLPTYVASSNLIPTPTTLLHSASATLISATPPTRSASPLARSLHTPPPSSSSPHSPPTTHTPSPPPHSTNSTTVTSTSSTPQTTTSSGKPPNMSPTKNPSELTIELHEWEIDFKELELGAVIGKGFFGEVKRGSWRETDVAIKIIYRDSFKSKTSFDMFMNEVCILSKLRHPCVVQFLGACTTGDTHCIVTEWMVGGSLRQFLNSHYQAITPLVRIKIGLDIAKGMNYLHGWTPPILHRDLSTRNILLDVDSSWSNTPHGLNSSLSSSSLGISSPAQPVRASSVRCKVADFGLSRLKLEHGVMTASVGCIPYMAPEVYKGEANSEKSDVYSYGMILWEVLSGEEPQQDMKPLKMAHLAAHAAYRPPLPASTHPAWRTLITACWTEDPEARPTFRSIIGSLKDMEEKEKTALAALRSLSSSTASTSLASSTASTASTAPAFPVFPTAPVVRNINVGEYMD